MTNVLSPGVAYELWAETYPPVAHNPLMKAEQAVVEPLLARLPARRALDVGTGSGRYVRVLAASSARVVGIDLSTAMLKRSRAAAPEFAWLRADASRLPFRRNAFDVVNASLMVGDVERLDEWAAEMARVLAIGGHLVYSDFHTSWVEHGWRRTFKTADGAEHAVAFAAHTIDEHLAALARAGFHVQAIREPRVIVAGRDTPVVVVFHAVKEAGTPR
jgi:ubiquinone/menaquinone biosynthesis C-methylase UbiE